MEGKGVAQVFSLDLKHTSKGSVALVWFASDNVLVQGKLTQELKSTPHVLIIYAPSWGVALDRALRIVRQNGRTCKALEQALIDSTDKEGTTM